MAKKPSRNPVEPGPQDRDEEVAGLRAEVRTLEDRLQESLRQQSKIEQLTHELGQKNSRIEKELEMAREFHRRLLPPKLPQINGIQVASKHFAADEVGCEIYDVFDMGNSCLGLFIGDVSGHGLGAALIMTIAKFYLHAYRVNEYSPKAILEKVNEELCCKTLESQFMTAFLGVLDLETNRMKFVNASHCPPILVSPERFELLDAEGMFCGMFEEPKYQEREIQLQNGDKLILHSDGVGKITNPAGAAFTIERLRQRVREKRETAVDELIQIIVKDVEEHLSGAAPVDDFTILGIELVSRAVKENRVVIPSEPKLLAKIEDAIQEKLIEFNYGERVLFAVRLAVEEAIINAMKHGNRMDKTKNVTVMWMVDQSQAAISVEDEGEGFDPEAVPDPTDDENLEVPHGRGLVLMRAYMDEVTYNDKGNRVTIIKRAPWKE